MAVQDSPGSNSFGLEVNSLVTPQRPAAKTTPLGAAANANLSAPANLTEIFQAGPHGARIHLVEGVPTATQAATQLQLYRSAADGVAKRHLRSKAMAAFNYASTSDVLPTDLGYSDLKPLTLGPLEKLWMGSGAAVSGINANVEGADF